MPSSTAVGRASNKLVNVEYPKYTIQSLLGISQGTHLTHTDACSKVVEFLNSSGNEEIQTEGSLSRMDNLPAHFLSKKVIPDVAWFTDTQHNQLVCAIEVESKNDRISSLVKLGLDLLEHLRYIRNRDDRITEITGFLFPLWTKSPARPTAVEEGTVKWIDDYFIFQLDTKFLDKGSVFGRIMQVATYQKQLMRGLQLTRSKFTIPLSSHFIEGQFGRGSFQVSSGDSFVVNANGFIFKAPFGDSERERLFFLLEKARSINQSTILFALPINNKFVLDKKSFFVFKAFKRPLSVQEAQSVPVMKEIAKSIHLALSSLHTVLNCAHLDVRLDNICFKEVNGSNQAILVDLDRSKDKDYSLDLIKSSYCGSRKLNAMYVAENSGWNTFNLDYRQLGILLSSLFNQTGDNLFVTNFPNGFIEKLYKHGECLNL